MTLNIIYSKMSKIYNGRNVVIKYYGNKIITTTYRGLKLIWQAIRSCFGKGFWDNSQPWNNDDSWNNG